MKGMSCDKCAKQRIACGIRNLLKRYLIEHDAENEMDFSRWYCSYAYDEEFASSLADIDDGPEPYGIRPAPGRRMPDEESDY
ncbi:MAG: hypothetical protein QXJ32_04890, partial [Thermoplasmata archaeon]